MNIFVRLAALALTVALSPSAHADDWPTRPITLITPFAPASTPDTLARVLAEGLGKRLGKAVVVKNEGGGAGMIGTNAVAKAAPDGYTIGVSVPGPLVNNRMLYKSMPYDPVRDLLPISVAVNQTSLLVVRNGLTARNLSELVAELKRQPGKYNYASIGNGSLSHLTMELLAARSGTRIVHVPYPGSSQAVMAMISSDVDMAVLPALAVLPQVKAGKLRVIGASTAKRSALLPDIPTLSEQGMTDIDAGAWMGIVAPASLPAPIAKRLHDEIVAVLNDPATRTLLDQQMMDVVASTPEEFKVWMDKEYARWKPVIEANKIVLD